MIRRYSLLKSCSKETVRANLCNKLEDTDRNLVMECLDSRLEGRSYLNAIRDLWVISETFLFEGGFR